MNPFAYDFGYAWPWNYGHVIPAVVFGALAVLSWKRRWPSWTLGVSTAIGAWALVGLAIVQLVMRLNLPLELPTENFLSRGSGVVLDAGAGSGRSSLMVLLARPESRVLAVDIYDGYYGIIDNQPDRLFANARKAGVEDRIEARVGDIRAMDLADASVDAAVSAHVIDHLSKEGVQRSLAEIERVLRPNGDFLLMVVSPDVWIRVAYPFFVAHGYFGGTTNPEWWRSRLTDAGFDVVEDGTVPGTLYLLARKPDARSKTSRETGQPSK